MTEPTLSLTVAPAMAALPPGEHRVFVAVELRASGAPVEAVRPQLAVSFALDLSGSMQGPPIEQVARSVLRLVDLLRPEDRVGIVGFADSAVEIAPLRPLDDAARRSIRARMRRLTADGRTHLEAGLKRAREQLGREPEPGVRRAVLLLSDGQPNVGADTPEELGEQVRRMRPEVSVGTLGFGDHHAGPLLQAVAEAGGGQYRYIPDAVACQTELAQALGAQGDVVVEALELVLVPAEGVEIQQVLGAVAPRYTAEGMIADVPDLVDGAVVTLAVELSVRLAPEHIAGRLLSVTARYRAPGQLRRRSVTAAATVDVAAGAPCPNPEALGQVLLVRADAARQRARDLADQNQFASAAARLRAVVAEIEAVPGFVPDDGSPLAEAREALLDEIQAFERVPSPEDYHSFKLFTAATRLACDGRQASSKARGGRFSVALCESTSGPAKVAHLVLVTGPAAGQCFPLDVRNVLGRTRTADIVIPDPSVSRCHAEIQLVDGHFWLRDAASTNLTRVNGKRLGKRPHRLATGDLVTLGDVQLEYRDGPAMDGPRASGPRLQMLKPGTS